LFKLFQCFLDDLQRLGTIMVFREKNKHGNFSDLWGLLSDNGLDFTHDCFKPLSVVTDV
jgi:hypothetical protein